MLIKSTVLGTDLEKWYWGPKWRNTITKKQNSKTGNKNRSNHLILSKTRKMMASVSFLKTPYLINIKITDLVLQTGLDLTETGWTVQLWRYLVKSNPIESSTLGLWWNTNIEN